MTALQNIIISIPNTLMSATKIKATVYVASIYIIFAFSGFTSHWLVG